MADVVDRDIGQRLDVGGLHTDLAEPARNAERRLEFANPFDERLRSALIAHRSEWKNRAGQQVRKPSHHVKHWPDALTFQVQVDFFNACKLKRLDDRKSYPYSCGACGNRFITKDGLTHHGRYCTGRGHLKPSRFHTPANTLMKRMNEQQQQRKRKNNRASIQHLTQTHSQQQLQHASLHSSPMDVSDAFAAASTTSAHSSSAAASSSSATVHGRRTRGQARNNAFKSESEKE